jgi:hypothetical protein
VTDHSLVELCSQGSRPLGTELLEYVSSTVAALLKARRAVALQNLFFLSTRAATFGQAEFQRLAWAREVGILGNLRRARHAVPLVHTGF